MSKLRDYPSMLRRLREYRSGFDARNGFTMDKVGGGGRGKKAKAATKAARAAITREHGKLKTLLLESHIVYRTKDRAKLAAVQRASGMGKASKFRVAIVPTPMPELTKVKVGRGKSPKVAIELLEAKVRKGRKASALSYESRDWNPERLALDIDGELRRLTKGDKPSTKYILKAGDRIMWRMGYPVGPDQLAALVREITSGYLSVQALSTWATGFWAFSGSDADFKKVLAEYRIKRDEMVKVRRKARRVSRRERIRGRR